MATGHIAISKFSENRHATLHQGPLLAGEPESLRPLIEGGLDEDGGGGGSKLPMSILRNAPDTCQCPISIPMSPVDYNIIFNLN